MARHSRSAWATEWNCLQKISKRQRKDTLDITCQIYVTHNYEALLILPYLVFCIYTLLWNVLYSDVHILNCAIIRSMIVTNNVGRVKNSNVTRGTILSNSSQTNFK